MSQVIRERTTFDGVTLQVWDDGDITDRVGQGFTRIRLPVAVALMVAEEATICETSEVETMIRHARSLVRAGKEVTPGVLRAAGEPKRHARGVLWSQTGAFRARSEHIRNCRKLRCVRCGVPA